METTYRTYLLTDDIARVDFVRVQSWLAATYWSPGIPRDVVERAARYSSLVVCAFDGDRQIGYARVISDRATYGYIADVFVDPDYRRQGLGEAITRFCLDHPDHQNLRSWNLRTADAHAIYRKCGFEVIDNPERYMILRPGK